MLIIGDSLGIGITFASFQWFGTCAWQMDVLNGAVINLMLKPFLIYIYIAALLYTNILFKLSAKRLSN